MQGQMRRRMTAMAWLHASMALCCYGCGGDDDARAEQPAQVVAEAGTDAGADAVTLSADAQAGVETSSGDAQTGVEVPTDPTAQPPSSPDAGTDEVANGADLITKAAEAIRSQFDIRATTLSPTGQIIDWIEPRSQNLNNAPLAKPPDLAPWGSYLHYGGRCP